MDKQQTVYLTQEGLEDLRSELQFLRTKERARIAQDIAEARTQGDLSENAEYDAAKEAQGLLEAKIAKMEQVISNARIVDESQIDTSKAYILSKVRVKNLKTGMEQSYQLVSQREANLAQGRISVNSPIGKGLLGQEVGAVIDIVFPARKVQLKILEISR
jgi:transcription elongation factor GreA